MSYREEDFWSSQNHEDAVGFFGSVVGGAYLLLAIPAWLWRLYVDYLWKSDMHPWIASAAASFRLMAFLIIMPFALLSLLDVGGYVIARTLGVVETTKASTSDVKDARSVYSDNGAYETDLPTSPMHANVGDSADVSEAEQTVALAPEMDMSTAPSLRPASTTSTTSRLKQRVNVENLEIPIPRTRYTHFGRAMHDADGSEAEACFFSPLDERQLELSGANLSSPTPSRQGSPGLERRQRVQPTIVYQSQTYNAAASAGSDASSNGDSESFTILERSNDEPEISDLTLNAANVRRRGTTEHDDGGAGS